ncbi:MAG: bifunctional hydroxymethylpyrimidine kinase/phosphomethylpyrimidine kinase [Nitratireductor sp.]
MTLKNALTIAGSDSGGGAGIQADIKSMSANGVFATTVITALTAQNTLGVTAIHDVPADFIAAQMDAVFSDIEISAVKIGMLSRAETIRIVAEGLRRQKARNIVLDPVMVTTSGDPLIDDAAVESLMSELFPLATLVTPNMHEAARLTGSAIASNAAEMVRQAEILHAACGAAILLKGGHGAMATSDDLLFSDAGEQWFSAPRIDTQNTHGTGCSLSSAIAANLANGMPLADAVSSAKRWLSGAIAASGSLDVGKGHGPVHHFHNLLEE